MIWLCAANKPGNTAALFTMHTVTSGRWHVSMQVAKLAGLNGATIDESKPFAELW